MRGADRSEEFATVAESEDAAPGPGVLSYSAPIPLTENSRLYGVRVFSGHGTAVRQP